MPTDAGTALTLREVTKVYGKGASAVTAVDRVDLAVRLGEVVLIMGPSGSGKTTLLAMAGIVLRPTSGQILVMDHDLGALHEWQKVQLRRDAVGFVFQSFSLLSALTALENVLVPVTLAGRVTAADRRRAGALLEEFGLAHRVSARPAEMSAGEQQRVCVARALANDPPLLLADEPTANLDSQAGQHVVRAMTEAARRRDKAVVIVTHDPRIVDVADRVLWMEDGRISTTPPTATTATLS